MRPVNVVIKADLPGVQKAFVEVLLALAHVLRQVNLPVAAGINLVGDFVLGITVSQLIVPSLARELIALGPEYVAWAASAVLGAWGAVLVSVLFCLGYTVWRARRWRR